MLELVCAEQLTCVSWLLSNCRRYTGIQGVPVAMQETVTYPEKSGFQTLHEVR